MVHDIVLRCREFGIQLAAVWMSRNTEEMKLADTVSRGPWFPAQEFLLEKHLMEIMRANFDLTLDWIATSKNRVTEKYFSAVWEVESMGKNFFLQKNWKKLIWVVFLPQRIF